MTPDDLLARWPEAERILDPLLSLPPADRRARAMESCGDDQGLRQVMARLLELADIDGEVPSLPSELSTDDDSAPPPAAIGPYRVLDEIGRGGMSRVFRATREHGAVTLTVAIKLLDRRHSAGSIRRFDRERETLARLQHPHIARLYDGGLTDEGEPYLVMELVEGQPIDAFCAENDLDVEARLRLFHQVCQTVEFAHARLVVHRDIKPANVFVDRHGDVKLLDFGIAKWIAEMGTSPPLTRTMHLVMTPAHAAPEQFRGEPVTVATDVYQLGLLLYLLLTGRSAHAVEPSTAEALQRAVLDTDPERPSQAVRDSAALSRRLSGDLDAIVLKALRREPANRYASVEAFRRDIDNFLQHRPVTARRWSLVGAGQKFARRHRVGVAAASAAVVALAIGVIGVVVQTRATALERDRARAAEAKATAVNAYLVRDLLAAATPGGAQGRAMTVADVLANASRSVGYAFADQPATEAEVRTTLAESYTSLGRFADARVHAEAARDLLGRVSPSDEPARLRARAMLARLSMEEGYYEVSRREAEDILRGQLSAAGPDSQDVVKTRLLLVRALQEQGELAAAERMAREALAGSAHHPGAWSLSADVRSRMADVLIDLGRWLEAETLTREAIDLLRSRLGPMHPDVLTVMARRVRVLSALLRVNESLALAGEVVAASEQVFGESHPQTARARNALALTHDRLGHRREAHEQVELALAIFQKTLGPDHADTLMLLSNLAISVNRLEGPERAEPIYRQAFEGRLRVLGPRHVDTLVSAVGLVTLRLRMPGADVRGASLDVLRLCDQVAASDDSDPRSLDRCATFLLDDAPPAFRDPARARSLATRAVTAEARRFYLRLRTLARAQRAMGDWQDALATLREALALPQAIQSWTTEEEYVQLMTEHATAAELESWLVARIEEFRRLRGPEDRYMAKTQRHLARLYARAGRDRESEAQFAAVLAQLKKTTPDQDWEVGRAMSELGEQLVRRRAFADAEPLLIRGFESMIGDDRAAREHRAQARERVVSLYEQWGRSADADRWRTAPLQQEKSASGPS